MFVSADVEPSEVGRCVGEEVDTYDFSVCPACLGSSYGLCCVVVGHLDGCFVRVGVRGVV